jgi:hypothetical protein
MPNLKRLTKTQLLDWYAHLLDVHADPLYQKSAKIIYISHLTHKMNKPKHWMLKAYYLALQTFIHPSKAIINQMLNVLQKRSSSSTVVHPIGNPDMRQRNLSQPELECMMPSNTSLSCQNNSSSFSLFSSLSLSSKTTASSVPVPLLEAAAATVETETETAAAASISGSTLPVYSILHCPAASSYLTATDGHAISPAVAIGSSSTKSTESLEATIATRTRKRRRQEEDGLSTTTNLASRTHHVRSQDAHHVHLQQAFWEHSDASLSHLQELDPEKITKGMVCMVRHRIPENSDYPIRILWNRIRLFLFFLDIFRIRIVI